MKTLYHKNQNWFIIDADKSKHHIDIVAWLDSTIDKNDWTIFRIRNDSAILYGFSKSKDAMLFKLTWS
jgi:Holliday junction resolvasome RuvABC DNA-binding subunit